ncbi:serine/threonine-protein kinase [Rubritalea sp.]|uniref:serine/threonine-protein kinase n=1 Tax=Rubritalea sp. TaxID=2109375 RepID=UPI003F4AEBCE
MQKLLSWALTEKLEHPLEVGDPDLPGFDVLSVLGRGGMGTVYLAKHHGLGREVALKLFTANGSDQELFLERLKREGRLMAQLEHPNVLGIYDGDVLPDGTPYLVLEYVKGEDLQKRISREKKLSQKEALSIAIRVLNGLSAVHALGVTHRDVKPANVLLGEDGSVKVTDFGVSKVAQEEQLSLTMTGTTIGTVDYMAPEQSNGDAVDERSDIYSVGVILYEMLAGVTPRGAFEPLSKYGVSKELNRLVMRCLQRDPNRRPASAANLARQLRKVRRDSKRGFQGDVKRLSLALLGGTACVLVAGLFIFREMRETPSVVLEPDQVVDAKENNPSSVTNLIEGYSLQKASLAGKWWRHSGALFCESSEQALIEFPSDLADEYVVDSQLTRVDQVGKVVLFLPTSQGLIALETSEEGIQVQGDNRRVKKAFKGGIAYSVRVEVSKQVLRVFVDEKRVLVRAIEALDIRTSLQWKIQDTRKLAIGAERSELIVNQYSVRPLQ